MKLVYVSPVPWSSINQRPHFFAKTVMEHGIDELLWIEPYPSRFPNLGDLVPGRHAPEPSDLAPMPGLKIISAGHLAPVEPIKLLFDVFNGRQIAITTKKVIDFIGGDKACLVIGKPCRLSLALIGSLSWNFSCYDAMDDFPSFYNGLSRKNMIDMEISVAERVDIISCSSHALYLKFPQQNKVLVLNACADDLDSNKQATTGEINVFGYIGTIAGWFDWSWVIKLANLNPTSSVLLIGPVKTRTPSNLPANIILKGSIPHSEVMSEISNFDVGIIPFLVNDITMFVDPVKYYEYALSGKPIISTAFGEMIWHHNDMIKDTPCPYKTPEGSLFFPHDHIKNHVPRWTDRFSILYDKILNHCV